MMNEKYEAGVIVKLLGDNAAFDNCDLMARNFTNKQYGMIYKVMQDFSSNSEPFDILTVCERLNQKTGQEWLGILAGLTKDTVVPSSILTYVDIIKNFSQEMSFKQLCEQSIINYQEPGERDRLIERLMALNSTNAKNTYDTSEAMRIAVDDIDRAFRGENTGLKTGLDGIDNVLGGFHNGDLVIIGARPAMGKTSLLLNLACGILNNGESVGIFSGEQGISQIMQRLIAIEGRISVARMRNGDLQEGDWAKLNIAGNAIKNKDWNMHVCDKPAPSLMDIVREARKWKHTYNLKVLFIDYIQRIKVDPKIPRHEAVGEVAKGLKELARTLDIPVVCLAQVNRSVESRTDKRPNMGDLKDSGGIEQEADQVMMLYRGDVYDDPNFGKGFAELNIVKNRHGMDGKIITKWIPEFMIFEN